MKTFFHFLISLSALLIGSATIPLALAGIDNTLLKNPGSFYVTPAPKVADTVTARLTCDRLFAGAGTTLFLRINGRTENTDLNLIALERDFIIHQVTVHHRDWLTSTGFTLRTEWRVDLTPKRLGELVIPTLAVADLYTQPIRLTVQERQEADDARLAQHVLIETEASPDNPYLHSQILYTVRMLYDGWLIKGELSKPVFNHAYAQQVGKHRSYNLERSGKRFQVSERRYAVFPEKRGQFVIPGAVFTGEIGYPSHQQHAETRCSSPLQLTAKPNIFNVRSPPIDYQEEYWLPSTQLTLQQISAELPAEVPLGEPLLLELAITGHGLSEAVIPDLKIPAIAGVRLYQRPRHTRTENTATGIISHVQQHVMLVPSDVGQIVIPEIRLPWWDTVQQRKRIARLPAQAVTIRAAEVGTGSTIRQAGLVGSKAANAMLEILQYIAFAILAIAIVVMMSLLPELYRRLPVWQAQWAVRRACRRNDPSAAARALLRWAALIWPPQMPRSLGDLSQLVGADCEPLQVLDRSLYADAYREKAWRGADLYPWFKHQQAQWQARLRQHNQVRLLPLYPETNRLITKCG